MELPKWGDVLRETKERKEVWAWDGIVPSGDVTLVAAFMKKGKTTLLTGLVNGMLRRGSYCGRGTSHARKVLYLAPEEGDTLVRRFERLGFGETDGGVLTVVPRRHRVWGDLITAYRTREWGKVVRELKESEYDVVVLDGLHTLLQLFEPMAKEDNEGVGRFMSQFVLPFGSEFTVICSLHTKKSGGDPRVRVPPEEMIRGASAWMAHPGQILVMDHDRRADTKTFHAFGRYEGTTAQGWVLKYDEETHDYRAMEEDGFDEEKREQARLSKLQNEVLGMVGKRGPLTRAQIQDALKVDRSKLVEAIKRSVATGVLREMEGRSAKAAKTYEVCPDPGKSPEVDEG